VNSLHLWSVEIFFFSMVIHLWGKYFMAAWRGGRAMTWMTGMVLFLVSIVTALTGYVSQSQLRLAMDLHPGQGRHQLHRRRCVFNLS
jgi:quinol-cytochrome oxidoreductase complex cytochrome b subunit